ncbi:MAG: 4Fe-4S binding protein [Spirochaetales bacterium]|nr:4Fe-4S binding protein [Spirochaetales bacterium]
MAKSSVAVMFCMCECFPDAKKRSDAIKAEFFEQNREDTIELHTFSCTAKTKIGGDIGSLKGKNIIFTGCSHLLKIGFYDDVVRANACPKSNYRMINIKGGKFDFFEGNDSWPKKIVSAILAEAATLSENLTIERETPERYSRVLVYGSGLKGLRAAAHLKKGFPSLDILETEDGNLSAGMLSSLLKDKYCVTRQREIVEEGRKIGFISSKDIQFIQPVEQGFRVADRGGNVTDYGAIVFAPETVEAECTETGAFNLTGFYRYLLRGEPMKGTACFLADYKTALLPEVFGDVLSAAHYLKSEKFMNVFIFLKNIQVCIRGRQALYDKAREAGVVFIKYADEIEADNTGGEFTIRAVDEQSGRPCVVKKPDFLVIPQKLFRSPEADEFARAWKLNPEYGSHTPSVSLFIGPNGTVRQGIFTVGPSEDDADLESLAYVLREFYLEERQEFEEHIAVVDSEKCAYCLTCVRVCPFGAINKNPSDKVAMVLPFLCRACGTCVAECPAQAVQLRNMPNESLYDSVKLILSKGDVS